MDWFRSWHGAPTDNKWLVIGKKAGVSPGIVSAVVWALFDYASQSESRGSIADFDIETYAAFSGFEEEQIGAILNALIEKEIIKENILVSWDRRQPKREDNSSSRVKKHRGNKIDETHSNASVTHSNAPEKIQTREDTDTEKKYITPSRAKYSKPEDVSEPVWRDFKTLRDGKKAKITQTAIDGIRREAGKAGISLEAALREMCTRGWQGFKAEWLNSKGNGNETTSRNSPNRSPGTGNKHERAKAALLKSGIELGYVDPFESR